MRKWKWFDPHWEQKDLTSEKKKQFQYFFFYFQWKPKDCRLQREHFESCEKLRLKNDIYT